MKDEKMKDDKKMTVKDEKMNSLDCFPSGSHLNLYREPTIPSSRLASSCVQM